jgi:hypothetical protein
VEGDIHTDNTVGEEEGRAKAAGVEIAPMIQGCNYGDRDRRKTYEIALRQAMGDLYRQ